MCSVKMPRLVSAAPAILKILTLGPCSARLAVATADVAKKANKATRQEHQKIQVPLNAQKNWSQKTIGTWKVQKSSCLITPVTMRNIKRRPPNIIRNTRFKQTWKPEKPTINTIKTAKKWWFYKDPQTSQLPKKIQVTQLLASKIKR